MKKSFFFVLFFLLLVSTNSYSQVFNGDWICLYATIDDNPNGTNYNTASVGVIKPNTFVALVHRPSNATNYLVGYTNADSVNGRMGWYEYGTSGVGGYRHVWASGFDNVEMMGATDLATTKDSMVYVANNDIERNILVFKMSEDSVISTEYRLTTGVDTLWAIDVDAQGHVFVTKSSTDAMPDAKVLVFNSITADPQWSGLHQGTPMTTITLPEPGMIRGVTVNDAGSLVYVSNYSNKKVYCYIGSPAAGYTLFNGFNFTLTDQPMATNGVDTIFPGPMGLQFIEGKNILMVACAQYLRTGVAYEYSRVYFVNPNTGAILDTLDAAMWNFEQTGSYQSRPNGGTLGNVSGYASLYACDYDSDDAVYTVSYYGWTVDKWQFSGTLPTIPLTILSADSEIFNPQEFTLEQNYPNPFNPSTTITYQIPKGEFVTLKIYDVLGVEVKTLVSQEQLSGRYSVTFDGSNLSSGIYMYQLRAGELISTKKLILMK